METIESNIKVSLSLKELKYIVAGLGTLTDAIWKEGYGKNFDSKLAGEIYNQLANLI